MAESSNRTQKPDPESRFYLRVTLIVTAGMIAGGLLQ